MKPSLLFIRSCYPFATSTRASSVQVNCIIISVHSFLITGSVRRSLRLSVGGLVGRSVGWLAGLFVGRLVGWSDCQTFLEGREVTLSYSY